MHVMMDLKVTLDFSCCGCEECVTVTVQCKGEYPAGETLPAVNVPAPAAAPSTSCLSNLRHGSVRAAVRLLSATARTVGELSDPTIRPRIHHGQTNRQ